MPDNVKQEKKDVRDAKQDHQDAKQGGSNKQENKAKQDLRDERQHTYPHVISNVVYVYKSKSTEYFSS